MRWREERSKSARTQLCPGHDRDSRRLFLSSGEIEVDQSSGEIEHIYWHLAYSHAWSSRSNDIAFGIPTSNYINRNIMRYRPVPHRDYIGKNSATRCMLIGQKYLPGGSRPRSSVLVRCSPRIARIAERRANMTR